MKKRLFRAGRLLLGIALFVGTVVFVTYKEHRTAQKYKASCEKQFVPTPAPSPEKNPSGEEECKDPNDYLPWWYILLSWPEGITTWAIIATGFVIAWQAVATQQAANVGKTAAKAALGQIDIMKAKDRAHLTVDAIPPNLPITDIEWKTAFEIENIGSTHAFDIVVLAMFEFATFGITPPIPAVAGIGSMPHIGADKSERFSTWTVTRRENGEIKAIAGGEQMREVMNGKMFLHLRGSVDYRDIFGDKHVKPFRFIWVADMESVNLAKKPNPRWMAAVHYGDPKET